MLMNKIHSKVSRLEAEMNNRRNLNLGDDILNIVQDAVKNRDFNRLNCDIGNIVNGALDEARRSFERNRERHQNWNNTWVHNTQNSSKRCDNTWDNQSRKEKDTQNNRDRDSQEWKGQASNWQSYQYNNRNNYTSKPVIKPAKFTVPVGRVSGILFTVFGAIGSTAFAIAAIILGGIGFLTGSGVVYQIITMGLSIFFIGSIILLLNGRRLRKRVKRFQRYISQMHGRNYCLIKDFSSVTGRSNKYTVKDLQKMINIGMFPEGHIDDKKTCFMLNNESYGQYLKLQENMKMRDMEDRAKEKEQTMSQEQMQEDKKVQKDKLDPVIRKAMDEGRQYVKEIRNANIAIPGEEISRKLDKLEEVTRKIFDYVEEHPEKFPEIKKFAEYFLPTTLKLLDAYRELDYQPMVGENIPMAKKEIENTMDTINLAFENLLDDLFEDVAMDISTDISVLETMLAQEGLTEKMVRN